MSSLRAVPGAHWGRFMSRSTTATPFPLGVLRRQVIAMGTAAGLPAARAADLAHHVLWYETLGGLEFGLRALPRWLAHRGGKAVDLTSSGRILDERAGIARLDGARALAPLVMSHALTIASEKARENGVAVIQVTNLVEPCPSGDVALREALGPVAIAILTARPSWVLAIPSAGDLPFLADSDLQAKPAGSKSPRAAAPGWVASLAPMLAGFAPEPGGAMVLALHVSALDSPEAFRDRLARLSRRAGTWLTPARLKTIRQEAEERGLPISVEVRNDLDALAVELGLPGLGA